jgi:transposase
MEVFMAKSKAERARFSSRKKMDVVLRVLRGDDLDLVSREAGITTATLSARRDQFVTSGQAGWKSRSAGGRDDELARLKALVGESMVWSGCVKNGASPFLGEGTVKCGRACGRRGFPHLTIEFALGLHDPRLPRRVKLYRTTPSVKGWG